MCMSSMCMSLRCRSFFVYEMRYVSPYVYVLYIRPQCVCRFFCWPSPWISPFHALDFSIRNALSFVYSLRAYVTPCVCPSMCLSSVGMSPSCICAPLPCVCLSSPCPSVGESLRGYAPSVSSVHMSLCVGPLCGLWTSQYVQTDVHTLYPVYHFRAIGYITWSKTIPQTWNMRVDLVPWLVFNFWLWGWSHLVDDRKTRDWSSLGRTTH